MILEELLNTINDNTVVEVYRCDTAECIGVYDGKDSIPERYGNCEITDIFAGVAENGRTPTLCIEIDVFSGYVDDNDEETREELMFSEINGEEWR